MSHYEEQRQENINPHMTQVQLKLNLPEPNKYQREIKGAIVDVYDVLKGFNVTCPAMQHAIKKMLCTGLRGHKDFLTDADEAIQSIERAKELHND